MTLPYLAVAVYVTIVIIGVVGVHAAQAVMAIMLFLAADKVMTYPTLTSQPHMSYRFPTMA